MRDGIQAGGHFLERLLFIQGGENGKQGPIEGVEGRLALQKGQEGNGKYNTYLLSYLFSTRSVGHRTPRPDQTGHCEATPGVDPPYPDVSDGSGDRKVI